MRILVLGGDGFLGWPMALYLSRHGHDVAIVDNLWRRQIDAELGIESLVPIEQLPRRTWTWNSRENGVLFYEVASVDEAGVMDNLVQKYQPEAIVHFAEQRCAPYSMRSRNHAAITIEKNLVGTLNIIYAVRDHQPDCHIVKLGTMGEYGTPNIDIEEGYIEIHHKGRSDRMLYPKNPGSWYHATKCDDSLHLKKACDWWNLRVTDLNQGVVYGVETAETKISDGLATRFDYDGEWGTVVNRFCVQAAIGFPLTVYGRGGQTRGMINILDTLRCIELALENPPQPGTFEVFNQITGYYSVLEVAQMVQAIGEARYGLRVQIQHIENPRVEDDSKHYFNPAFDKFMDLGLEPHSIQAGIEETLATALHYKGRVRREIIMPTTKWRKSFGSHTNIGKEGFGAKAVELECADVTSVNCGTE